MKKNICRIFLTLAAASAMLASFGLSACNGKSAHTAHAYGEWEETVAAECEKEGTRTRTCTYPGCGHTETEPIAPLGHDWGIAKVTVPATCQHGGKRTKTCSRCQKSVEEDTDPIDHDWIPISVEKKATCEEGGKETQRCSMCETTRTAETAALGHDWGDPEIREPATCKADGKEIKTCKRDGCGETVEETIPKLNHQWKNTATLEEATCTEAGLREQTCQRPGCGETQTVEIPALGHSWQGYYTVDQPASFEAAGSKSYHCNRCDQHTGETEIPMLEEGKPIEYEFRTLRNTGKLILSPDTVITVYDGDERVAESTRGTMVNGVFKVDLEPKTYTVKVTGLPVGYTANETYTVKPGNPFCNVYLTASLREGPLPAGTRYALDSVMYDFTVPDANSTVEGVGSLSEILAEKKMVLLNFWFVGCVYCEDEFPYLERAYEKYRDSVEVLAIDLGDSMAAIRQYGTEKGLKFPLVQNEGVGLINPFGITNYPVSVVIDAEGVVAEIMVGGGATAETFEKLFEKYTSDTYLPAQKPAEAQAVSQPLPAVLPGKREN